MRIKGNALLWIVVAVAASSITLLELSRWFVGLQKATNSVKLDSELASLRQLITNSLDCGAIFSAAGIDPMSPGSSCGSTSAAGGQVGPYLPLFRRTATSTVPLGTFRTSSPLAGTTQIGNYYLRTTCSASEQSLVVRVGRYDESGAVINDPVLGQAKSGDFESPRSLLFGGATIPLCFDAARQFGVKEYAAIAHNTMPCAGNLSACRLGEWVPMVWGTSFPAVIKIYKSSQIIVDFQATGNWDGGCAGTYPVFGMAERLNIRISNQNSGNWMYSESNGGEVGNGGGPVTYQYIFYATPSTPGTPVDLEIKWDGRITGPQYSTSPASCLTGWSLGGVVSVRISDL